MAFVPTPPSSQAAFLPRSTGVTSTRSPRFRPRLSARRYTPARMATGDSDGQEEVSVPLSSLKDISPPAPTATPIDAAQGQEEEDLRSEKQKENDRLRAAEKFIQIEEGSFECTACSYLYEPEKGATQMGIAAGTPFEELSPAFVCPVCRSPKSRFLSKKKIIAGFADNQSYGFGSNTMTGGQKTGLIFGGLLICFLLLLSGYALN